MGGRLTLLSRVPSWHFAQDSGSKTECRRLGLAATDALHGDVTSEVWTGTRDKFRERIDINLKLKRSVGQCDYRNVLLLENCAVLGCHAESTGHSLPTFRQNISDLSSRFKNLLGFHDSPNLNHNF